MTLGRKDDAQKPRFSLLPMGALRETMEVFEYGAKKYAPWNHTRVEGWRERYYNAAMRHLLAWFGGETHDPESGRHHLGHALCCLMILYHREEMDAGICKDPSQSAATVPPSARPTDSEGELPPEHEPSLKRKWPEFPFGLGGASIFSEGCPKINLH